MDDLAFKIRLDLSEALTDSRQLHSQLQAIESEILAVDTRAQTMVADLAVMQASVMQQASQAVVGQPLQQTVTMPPSLAPVATTVDTTPTAVAAVEESTAIVTVNEAVEVSAVEAEAGLSRVDAALQMTRETAESTGNWIKENPLLAFNLANAASKAMGAGSLLGAAATFTASIVSSTLGAITVAAVTTAAGLALVTAGVLALGQVIPTSRIDSLAESLHVARTDTELLTTATMALVDAQRSGASIDVITAVLGENDTQRGRAIEMPKIDTRQATIATALGGDASKAVTLVEKITYEIDLPQLQATAKEARREVSTIAADLANVSSSTSGVGWSQISTLATVANLSNTSVKNLGTSVEELRMRAFTNAAAFDAMGVSVLTAEGGLQSSAEVAWQFARALKDMTSEEQAAALASMGLSASTQAVVRDMAAQALAISQSRSTISEDVALTAAQERARAADQITALTTMTQAVGSRLKNWSDSAIEAVTRPVSKAAADLTTWVGGGVAVALTQVDGTLAWIESQFTGVEAKRRQLLSDSPTANSEAQQPTVVPIKVTLSEVETAGDETAQREAKVASYRQRLAELAASHQTGGLDAGEYADATAAVTRQIDAATGGVAKRTAEIEREIEITRLATAADRQRAELLDKGTSDDNAAANVTVTATLTVERELAALRERQAAAGETAAEALQRRLAGIGATDAQIVDVQQVTAATVATETLAGLQERIAKAGETEAETRRRALAEQGLTSAQIVDIENLQSAATAAEMVAGLQREIVALTQTEAETRRQSLADRGLNQDDVARVDELQVQLAVQKELQAIEQQRRQLADEATVQEAAPNASQAEQREQLAARQRLDRLRKAGADESQIAAAQAAQDDLAAARSAATDRDRAKRITEQLDPTIKLRQEREELDRLHEAGLIVDDTYAKGIAEIEGRWNKATTAVQAHRNVLNKGIDVYSTEAIDTVMRGIGDLTGPSEPLPAPRDPDPLLANAPQSAAVVPPVASALTIPTRDPLAVVTAEPVAAVTPRESLSEQQLKAMAQLLAQLIAVAEQVREASESTAKAIDRLVDNSETI